MRRDEIATIIMSIFAILFIFGAVLVIFGYYLIYPELVMLIFMTGFGGIVLSSIFTKRIDWS